MPADKVGQFGADTPLGRAGQPAELAPAYVFLASEDSIYITGERIGGPSPDTPRPRGVLDGYPSMRFHGARAGSLCWARR